MVTTAILDKTSETAVRNRRLGGRFCYSKVEGRNLKYVIADIGTNRYRYGNQGILLNSDGLKQYLFGPIDGPPRNTTQIGQPG